MLFLNKALFAALVLVTTPALAELCTEAVPVVRGNPPDCEGLLLPTPWALSGLECLQVTKPTLESRLELVQAGRASCERTLSSTIAQAEKTFDKYEAAVRRAAAIDRAWWRSPVLWALIAGTAGLGLGLAAGIAF